jgi:RNA polymerase sigma-70 factor, ECF subfamily
MSEEQLIRRAKEGNRLALQQLIERYYPVVERFAFQLGSAPHEVDDITQEVFIRVYRFIHTYSKAKFSTWLYKITLNVIRDTARKKSQTARKVVKLKRERQEDKTEVEYVILQSEEDQLLHQCIQQLDEKYRVPLILFYFHEKKYDEISDIMDIQLSTVKTRLLRAKKMLRLIIENQNADGGETVWMNEH